jgi:hypothetical protein
MAVPVSRAKNRRGVTLPSFPPPQGLPPPQGHPPPQGLRRTRRRTSWRTRQDGSEGGRVPGINPSDGVWTFRVGFLPSKVKPRLSIGNLSPFQGELELWNFPRVSPWAESSRHFVAKQSQSRLILAPPGFTDSGTYIFWLPRTRQLKGEFAFNC